MTARDCIERFANSVFQHGPLNNRVYLMKAPGADCPGIFDRVEEVAAAAGYGKIFAKIRTDMRREALNRGYVLEASVPCFFDACQTGDFVSKYLDPRRALDARAKDEAYILAQASARGPAARRPLIAGAELVRCNESHAAEMAALYGTVFESYPFPIDQARYIVQTMRSHVAYFGCRMDGRLVALSSAEMDRDAPNVEMTDFATLDSYRGRGLAQALLNLMEEHMSVEGIPCAYTIARACSPGMNATFARMGYQYAGKLINNTNIAGRFESMNVWHKLLPAGRTTS